MGCWEPGSIGEDAKESPLHWVLKLKGIAKPVESRGESGAFAACVTFVGICGVSYNFFLGGRVEVVLT